MYGGSRKVQAKWNIRSDTSLQRESVGVLANSRVRYGDYWRCLDPVGIPTCSWYRLPHWNKIDM